MQGHFKRWGVVSLLSRSCLKAPGIFEMVCLFVFFQVWKPESFFPK